MSLTSAFGMAASPSAAGGGFSEGAACAAVGRRGRRTCRRVCRAPQTETGGPSILFPYRKKPHYRSSEALCSRYLSSRGSDGSAASGRASDLSEWQRSVCNAGAQSPRRTQGTATGARQVLSAYMSLTSVFGMAASPSAAGGGFSEGAACAAVGRRGRPFSRRVCRVPQTETGGPSILFPHRKKPQPFG